MFIRISNFLSAACLGLLLVATQSLAQAGPPGPDGLIKVRSAR